MTHTHANRPTHPLLRVIDHTLEGFVFLALAMMAAVVALNVFCRFVLDSALSWGDETAQILMVWLTFLGAALATRDLQHFAFDYLVRTLSGRWRKTIVLFSDIVVIVATLLVLYWSGQVTWAIRDWVMPANVWLSRSFVYGACPVGCIFILVYAIRNFVDNLRAPEIVIAGPADIEPDEFAEEEAT